MSTEAERTPSEVAVRRIARHLLGEDVVNIRAAMESFPNGYTVVPKGLTTTETRCCGLREREHPTWPVYSDHPFGWPEVLAKAWRSYFQTHMDELNADVAEAHAVLTRPAPEGAG